LDFSFSEPIALFNCNTDAMAVSVTDWLIMVQSEHFILIRTAALQTSY